MYDYLEDLSPSSSDTLEDTSANLCIKGEFLNYLLLQKDLQVSIALVWKFSVLFLNSGFWGWLSTESPPQNAELDRF